MSGGKFIDEDPMAAHQSHLNRIVGFTEMQHGTREDYQLLEIYEREYVSELPGRILASLEQLSGSLGGYPVTRLEHSLQAATRARRDGADDELVVAALIHDLGDELAPFNHAEIACAIIRPYVRPQVTWIVEQHGLFQSYYYAHHLGANRDGRERFRGHPWYQACKDFCANWDQNSFDPKYRWDALESFEPLVRKIFTRKPWDPAYVAVQE
jgi:predicted HD phosphohydrolase